MLALSNSKLNYYWIPLTKSFNPPSRDHDMKAILAGFGKYYRESCQTNSHGPMKYHYCQTDPLCLSTNCSPKFSDGIKEQGSVESYLRVQYFFYKSQAIKLTLQPSMSRIILDVSNQKEHLQCGVNFVQSKLNSGWHIRMRWRYRI